MPSIFNAKGVQRSQNSPILPHTPLTARKDSSSLPPEGNGDGLPITLPWQWRFSCPIPRPRSQRNRLAVCARKSCVATIELLLLTGMQTMVVSTNHWMLSMNVFMIHGRLSIKKLWTKKNAQPAINSRRLALYLTTSNQSVIASGLRSYTSSNALRSNILLWYVSIPP